MIKIVCNVFNIFVKGNGGMVRDHEVSMAIIYRRDHVTTFDNVTNVQETLSKYYLSGILSDILT